MTENSSSPKVSVIIPAYHEETKITTGLHDLFETLDFLQLDHEVIVIVDGDPKTEAAVSKYKNPHLKILSYTKNRGKGYALCHGVKAATGEVV
ncbi:MAG: glycosyltransferase, partial [candidate division WWE3 bacterium]|nr:glycosyltransferase [candidate division WWE3 bacterium]